MRSSYKIRSPSDRQEFLEVISRIENVYSSHRDHRTRIKGAYPDILLLVEQETKIVGAGGIFLAKDEGLFLTEEFFGIDLRLRFRREELCEFGRVVSFENSGSLLKVLVFALVTCALSEKKKAAICCTKPRLAAALERTGLPIERFAGSVIAEKVPEDYRGFFLSDNPPVPFLIEFNEKTLRAIDDFSPDLRAPDHFTPGARFVLDQGGGP